MNSRVLEYVVALQETGSLQGAAERCNATPGTVSAQITRLEGYLGVRIFESRSSPAILTPAGRLLLPELSKIVTQHRHVIRLARGH